MTPLLDELLALSHALGLEQRGLAILGEGNTSVKTERDTFWIKASGSSLATLQPGDVSEVNLSAVLELTERESMTEAEIEAALLEVLVDKGQKKPSVETFLHALLLSLGEARWVGHTHPVSVNQLLCSQHGAAPFTRHIFPDAIVVCGRHVAFIPYVDPGFALAKAVREELARFKAAHGAAPKVLLMENHGAVALGQSSKEVLNIMLMLDKWAKVLVGALSVGGVNYLPEHEADRIDQRLDEHYRRSILTTRA
jgi:rhamnose utilization protein RhaD (predicted bifunctional aldolase and dehydrogenase)